LLLETAKSLREDFLHQNAYHEVDTYSSSEKQFRMLELIIDLHHWSQETLEKGVPFKDIMEVKEREEIAKLKFIPEKDFPGALQNLIKLIKMKLSSMEGGD
jgi:V/A-type H+-transporting ATPase subunit A